MFCGFFNAPHPYLRRRLPGVHFGALGEVVFGVVMLSTLCLSGSNSGCNFHRSSLFFTPKSSQPLRSSIVFVSTAIAHHAYPGRWIGPYGLRMCTNGSLRTLVVRTDYLEYSPSLVRNLHTVDGRQKNNKC